MVLIKIPYLLQIAKPIILEIVSVVRTFHSKIKSFRVKKMKITDKYELDGKLSTILFLVDIYSSHYIYQCESITN